MRVCDVLIVGGGPAGSTCARELQQAGLDVVVCDRMAFPRDKVCAGWITPQVVTTLELDLAAYAAGGRTLQPIYGFCIGTLGDHGTRVRYDSPVSYGIRRCEFDHYLLTRTLADLRLAEPVRDLTLRAGEWQLNDCVRASMLVGAGGHFCPVARRLGAQLGRGEPVVAAEEVEFEMTAEEEVACTVEREVPEIFFSSDLKGYGWIFRKGHYLNIGLGRQDMPNLRQNLGDFLERLRLQRKIPNQLSAKVKGHAYLIYDQSARPLIGERVLLIGDAAGLAYPKSGEGIRPAIESGVLAAETIIAANGHYGRSQLDGYAQRMAERFGDRNKHENAIADFIPEWILRGIAPRLFGNSWFTRHVVLDRWFFHTQQAALEG